MSHPSNNTASAPTPLPQAAETPFQSGTQPIGTPTPAERRRSSRFPANVVVRIVRAAKGKDRRRYLGLTQNISATGALILMENNVDIGEKVELDLLVEKDIQTGRRVCGRVVRAVCHRWDWGGPWLSHAAVEFDEALPDLEPRLTQIAARQRRSGAASRAR